MIIHAGKEYQVKLTTSKPLKIESSFFPKLEKDYLVVCVCHVTSYTTMGMADVFLCETQADIQEIFDRKYSQVLWYAEPADKFAHLSVNRVNVVTYDDNAAMSTFFREQNGLQGDKSKSNEEKTVDKTPSLFSTQKSLTKEVSTSSKSYTREKEKSSTEEIKICLIKILETTGLEIVRILDEHIINFKPERSLEEITQYADCLRKADLAVKVEKASSLLDGLVKIPTKIKIEEESSTLLKKLKAHLEKQLVKAFT